jgi:hypothetical protein
MQPHLKNKNQKTQCQQRRRERPENDRREKREREGKGTSERDRAVHFAQQRQLDVGIITGVSTIIMDIYHLKKH